MNTIFQHGHVEVDDQPDLQTGQSKVGQQLRDVDRYDLRYAFHLDDDAVLDEEVNQIGSLESQPLVFEPNRFFRLDLQTERDELLRKGQTLDRLQQTGPVLPVNLDRGADDLSSNGVGFGHPEPLARSGASCFL